MISVFTLKNPAGGQADQCVLSYVPSLTHKHEVVSLILPLLAQGRLLQPGICLPRCAGLRRALLPLYRDNARTISGVLL